MRYQNTIHIRPQIERPRGCRSARVRPIGIRRPAPARALVGVRPTEELAAFRGIIAGVFFGGLFWLGLVKLVLSLS